MTVSDRWVGGHFVRSDERTSRRLARFGHETSRPERYVRAFLHRAGLRFRTSNRDLPGSPDVANRFRRWAVFVHGCFWHHHPGCSRATIPSRNRSFWLAKFRQNRRRDRRAVSELSAAGFLVVVVWECEVEVPSLLARRLRCVVSDRRWGRAP